MPRLRSAMMLATLALLAFHPLAHARPGLGGSFGSRGTRTYTAPRPTYTAPYAAPLSRPAAPYATHPYAYPRSYAAPSYARSYGYGHHPFFAGFAGGLGGVLLGHLLFGHGGYGGGFGAGDSIVSGLFWLIILGVLVWAGMRFLSRRRPVYDQSAVVDAPFFVPSAPATSAPQPDIDAALYTVSLLQQAWSGQNMREIEQVCTAEMARTFEAQLDLLARRGLRNQVWDHRIDQYEVSEAWGEGRFEYLTIALQMSMLDATFDGRNQVVEGSSSVRTTIAEVWTFRRAQGGGWRVSAIQQTR